jgi:site-specific recombinase XerD
MTMDPVDQYLISLKADGRTPATIEWHRHALGLFTSWLQQEAIPVEPDAWSPAVLRTYIVWLSERHGKKGIPLSPTSVNSMVRSLKAFCRWLHREEIIDRDLFSKVKVPKAPSLVMPTLSEGELKAILRVVQDSSRKVLRDEAIITLMLDTGARASEVCGLDLGHISFEQGLVHLFGKGRKGRVIPFSAVTSRVLLKYIRKERGSEPGPLFMSDRGNRLTRSGLLQLCSRIGDRAAVHFHPHQLRHTFALNYLRAGGNVLALQRLLGHTELSITTRYVAFTTDDLSDAHQKYSPVATMLK